MQKHERLQVIENAIQRNGSMNVSALSNLLGVSEMTIRRDLSILANQKRIVRSHGGASAFQETVLSEAPYELRLSTNVEKKKRIARAALPLIEPNSRVFFDCSTSVYELAKLVTSEHSFLAITDTLFIASELNSKPNVRVIMLGGELNDITYSVVGGMAASMIDTMHFNLAFLGFPSISEDGMLSLSSLNDLEIKQKVLQHADRKVVLIDSSKVRPPEFLYLGHISDLDLIITDDEISPAFVENCRRQNCAIMVVDKNGSVVS